MTIEAALVERKRAADGHIDKINKKKRCRRRAKPAAVPMALQRLFLSCRDVFKGPGTVPSPSDVRNLCDIIDIMMPEDVGLCRDLQFFKPRSHVKGTPRVTCTTIYNCQNFSLCIFFLPPTAVIPLHNHPGMTVFSKLLLGTMHIKSYDWADPVNSDDSMRLSQRHDFSARLAKLKVDKIYTAPCDTSVLYPTSGGNIHAFTAITPCAVLDVLGPPYSKEDGRDCSYYRDTPYTALPNGATGMAVSKEEGDSYGWLEEIEMPKDSQMDGIEYWGPRVIETNF